MHRLLWVFVFQLALPSLAWAERPLVVLGEAEYCDRVYACWMAKSLGGTLGQPLECQHGPHDVPFDAKLSRGIANDELDLELVWLKAMEENGASVDARILGPYWLKYVVIAPGEYGIGMRNMRRGLLPPLSGQFDNPALKHSNGGWARAEIWGCLAPGCPALAAQMAREDACVDHGSGEGTLAEMFVSAVESAAFVEHDREKLIAVGLAMIPDDSELAHAIHTVLAAWKAGKDWRAARQEVIDATKTGWFMAPRDVAFIVLGWLYGEGDYRKTLVITLNCGDDSDSTVATVGSILGILGGTRGIDPEWKEAVGAEVKTCILNQEFVCPKDLNELTGRTLAVARQVLKLHAAPVAIAEGPSDLSRVGELALTDATKVRGLWALSPYQIVWREPDCAVTLDYRGEPTIAAGAERAVTITVRNPGPQPKAFALTLGDVPAGWNVANLAAEAVTIPAGGEADFAPTITAAAVDPDTGYQLKVEVTGGARPIVMPLALIAGPGTVGPDDLALSSKGAVASSDSELDREPGCTPEANDGILASERDFSNRWHSTLATPHPHWVQVKLPRPAKIGRIVIRFADPVGHPVDFRGLVLPEGEKEMKEVFCVTGNEDRRSFRTRIAPVVTDTFRLVIEKSVNPVSLNAAQISEIELYPPAE